jgi:hypothetical protein
VVLLRKSVPQNHNLKTAAELGVIGVITLKNIYFGLLMSSALGVVNIQASGVMENKVLFTGVNNSGVVFVQLENPISESGCVGAQLVIPADSDIKDKILSIALTAKATSNTIVVKTNGCHVGSPAILKVAGDAGYFYVK